MLNNAAALNKLICYKTRGFITGRAIHLPFSKIQSVKQFIADVPQNICKLIIRGEFKHHWLINRCDYAAAEHTYKKREKKQPAETKK